jgi:hypothetical protein
LVSGRLVLRRIILGSHGHKPPYQVGLWLGARRCWRTVGHRWSLVDKFATNRRTNYVNC